MDWFADDVPADLCKLILEFAGGVPSENDLARASLFPSWREIFLMGCKLGNIIIVEWALGLARVDRCDIWTKGFNVPSIWRRGFENAAFYGNLNLLRYMQALRPRRNRAELDSLMESSLRGGHFDIYTFLMNRYKYNPLDVAAQHDLLHLPLNIVEDLYRRSVDAPVDASFMRWPIQEQVLYFAMKHGDVQMMDWALERDAQRIPYCLCSGMMWGFQVHIIKWVIQNFVVSPNVWELFIQNAKHLNSSKQAIAHVLTCGVLDLPTLLGRENHVLQKLRNRAFYRFFCQKLDLINASLLPIMFNEIVTMF